MEPARKFKIIVNSKECGTCSGSSPSAVAKNVVKKLCGTSSKAVRFSLKECKRGCERVCGPYQGRMEKLDRPYTRSGKKITHRVVCGKVRKMRGGRELVAEDFNRPKPSSKFNDEMIDGKPNVFFGGKNTDPFKFVVFNRERIKLLGKKSIGISVLEENDVKHVDLNNLSLELQCELSILRKNLEGKTEYRTIRDFLNQYSIFKNIKEQTFENVPDTYVDYSTKYKSRYNPNTKLVKYIIDYSILFFDFRQSKPRYCLVFTNNDFIVIDIKNGDIESIEKLFGEIYDHSYIYLLANNDNVPEFIKDKLNRLIEKEKEIREKIIKYYSNFDLKNIESKHDTLFNILKETFSDIHNEIIFRRLILQEEEFVDKQVKKSRNAHMKNNHNKKKINDVYKNGINEQYNYKKFLNRGKLLANIEKTEQTEKARRKAERNAEEAERNARRKAERNAEEDERKAKRNAEEAKRKAERNAEEDERKAKRNAEKEEAEFMNSISSKNSIKFNKQKYTKNERNTRMVKNFIEEYYNKDNDFMSKLLMWYCDQLSEIYKILSESFIRKHIIEKEFNVKLKEYLTAEKLYESESFPKIIDLNYSNQYEELKAFASFFIDTLNSSVKESYVNLYNLIITRKNPIKMGSKILFMNLKDDISSALEKLGIDYIEELKIPVSTVNNNRKQQQQQQQPEPTGNNRQQPEPTGNNRQQPEPTGNNNNNNNK